MKNKRIVLIIIIIILILIITFLYLYPKIKKPKTKVNPCSIAKNCDCNNYSCDCDYYDEKVGHYIKIECPTTKVY